MILRGFSPVLICVTLLGASVGPAFADRAPNQDELVRIEQTLRAAGYISWDEIELDDGVWEVDDARKVAGGQDCDIDISPETYQIVKIDC
jgi:hypothetical protein